MKSLPFDGDKVLGRSYIRVLYTNFPPAVIDTGENRFPALHHSTKRPYPGYCVEILQIIARNLRLHVKPVVASRNTQQSKFGAFINGSWTGAVGAIAGTNAVFPPNKKPVFVGLSISGTCKVEKFPQPPAIIHE